MIALKILASMREKGRRADFVLCIGDDRSDEDMFEGLTALTKDKKMRERDEGNKEITTAGESNRREE